jgi:hypothetical protein
LVDEQHLQRCGPRHRCRNVAGIFSHGK